MKRKPPLLATVQSPVCLLLILLFISFALAVQTFQIRYMYHLFWPHLRYIMGKRVFGDIWTARAAGQSTHPRGLKLAFPIRFQINRQTVHVWVRTLWKHAYSNILKILPPKNENFQIKKFWYVSYFCSKHRLWVHVRTASSAQNIDCGYSLEPPRWGGSNLYPQSMFWAEIRK